MDFMPFRLFTMAERIVRVYTEWMSSDGAWDLQVRMFYYLCTPIQCSLDKDTCRCHALWHHPLI